MRHAVRRDARWTRWGLWLLALGIASSVPWCRASGQPPKKEAPATRPTEAKKRKGPRGRLPRYYAKVVTSKQREEIYAIQARYQGEIARLQAEIDKLTEKRDEEVSAVLTDAQREEVAKRREEASKRRRKSRRASAAKTASS